MCAACPLPRPRALVSPFLWWASAAGEMGEEADEAEGLRRLEHHLWQSELST